MIESEMISEKLKPTLEQCIKKWVSVDDQLKELQDKIKPLREIKTKLTQYIDQSLKDKKWTNRVIELDYDAPILLKMGERKEYGSLTYGYIEKCLRELKLDKIQVDIIVQYLKEHRETKQVPEFKRV